MKKPAVRALLIIQFFGLISLLIMWFVSSSGKMSQAAILTNSSVTKLVQITGQPDYWAINQTIDQLDTALPKEIIKGIAWLESGWQQFDQHGSPKYNVNIKKTRKGKRKKTHLSCDWGMMQINDQTYFLNQSQFPFEGIQSDPIQNLKAGVAILEQKQIYVNRLKKKTNWSYLERRYHLKGRNELAIMLKAYNGFQRSWNYSEKVIYLSQSKPWEQAMINQLRDKTGYYYKEQMIGVIDGLNSSVNHDLVPLQLPNTISIFPPNASIDDVSYVLINKI